MIRYGAASVAALLVDMGVLALLVSVAQLPYIGAATISFVAGGAFLYAITTRYVFGFRRIANRAVEMPVFMALGLLGLAINTAVIYALVETFQLHYLLAKCAAAGCTFFANFALRKTLMFSRPEPAP
ncbi:MAG TPA: GtrA family protein [Steroidobacteraceae bacterium]|jgi:putative flippase GtrA